jgi:hypothetical protein
MEQTNNLGFPSDMLPMRKKASKDWALQFSKAFQNSNKPLVTSDNYIKWKKLSEGEQPIDQYKKSLGSRQRAGKPDMAWRNLDYTILPILPKFVRILKNKILSQPKDFKISAIDPWSINQERVRKNKIAAYVANQELIQAAQQNGVQVESPFEEGEVTPTNLKEVDLYAEAYPKNKHVVEMYDEIKQAHNVNNWDNIERDLVDEEVKQGFIGTHTYVDSKGVIRVDPARIDRIVTNPCEKRDFSDMTRWGTYIYMTISQLRVAAKNEIAKGEITEKQLAELASKTGKAYNAMSTDQIYNARTFGLNYQCPYDNEKVKILRWQAKSADTIAYVISNKDGRITLEPRDNPFWLDKKGVTDTQYENYQKEQGLNRKVLRTEIENIYEAWYVCDSNIVFNYGLKGDIQRNINSLAEAKFDLNLYTLDFKSIIKDLESVAHSAQLNWLQYLHHSAKSIPDGTAINKRALTEITIGGKAGVVLDSLDLVDQYVQTGNLVYTDKDKNGQQISIPFQQLRGGGNEKALHHLQMVFQSIDLIRNILGLNEATDASTISPDQGKGVSEMMAANTNTALGDFYYAFNYIYEETAKSIVRLVPAARKKRNPGYIEALGMESQLYSEANSDMDFLDFGISVDVGWNEEKKNSLRVAAQSSLKAAGGTLLPQDVYIIENEKNPERAFMILDAKTKQRKQEDEQAALRLQQMNGQIQQQSAQAAEQAKQQTLQLAHQLESEKASFEMQRLVQEYQLKAMLIKLEKGLDMNNEDKERMTQLLLNSQDNLTTLKAANISAQAKDQKKKMA